MWMRELIPNFEKQKSSPRSQVAATKPCLGDLQIKAKRTRIEAAASEEWGVETEG